MNRRVVSRGRRIAGLGGLLVLVACFLPWFRVGGDLGGLPAISSNAVAGNQYFGAGIVVFVVAVVVLALIVLPYAAGDQHLAIDRPASFVLAAGAGVIAFVASVVQLGLSGALGLPDRAPGLWLAGAGLAVVCWGAWELVHEHAGY